MKFLAALLLLVAAIMVAVNAYVPPVQRPHPNQRPFPSFPGQGPFKLPRFRRSPQEHGQIDVHAKKEGGKTSWSAEGQHKVWSNDHGSIHVSGGANNQPGKPQAQVGVGGSFHWG